MALLAALIMVVGGTASAATTIQSAAASTNTVNLVQDPYAEGVPSGTPPLTGAAPGNAWTDGSYGLPATSYKLSVVAGRSGQGLQEQVTKRGNGDAKWFMKPATLAGGQAYNASFYYTSTVATTVEGQYMVNGRPTFVWFKDLPRATSWSQATFNLLAPAGASVTLSYFVPLSGVGTVVMDDFSLTAQANATVPPTTTTTAPPTTTTAPPTTTTTVPPTTTTQAPPTTTTAPVQPPAGTPKGIVSVNFDDGWKSQFTNGVSRMHGNLATYYIIGSEITPATHDAGYMTPDQVKTLAAAGNEIGNHSYTHPAGGLVALGKTDTSAHLAAYTAAVNDEFDRTQAAIKANVGVTPTTCAYPEGTYDDVVLASASAPTRFKACRGVDGDTQNTASSLAAASGRYTIHAFGVEATTPVSVVKAQIDQAMKEGTWLVLFYHEVGTTDGGTQYTTTPAALDAEMAYLATQRDAGNTQVMTMTQALAAVG